MTEQDDTPCECPYPHHRTADGNKHDGFTKCPRAAVRVAVDSGHRPFQDKPFRLCGPCAKWMESDREN